MASDSTRERVLDCLRRFLKSTGRPSARLLGTMSLTRDLGLKSDEGVDFVLDLCKEFDFSFAGSFNPFVSPDGKRGLKIDEMIKAIDVQLTERAKEAVL